MMQPQPGHNFVLWALARIRIPTAGLRQSLRLPLEVRQPALRDMESMALRPLFRFPL